MNNELETTWPELAQMGYTSFKIADLWSKIWTLDLLNIKQISQEKTEETLKETCNSATLSNMNFIGSHWDSPAEKLEVV